MRIKHIRTWLDEMEQFLRQKKSLENRGISIARTQSYISTPNYILR